MVTVFWLRERGTLDFGSLVGTSLTRRVFDIKTRSFTHGDHEYAILSHRWDEVELTYKDFTTRHNESTSSQFKKFNGFCRVASETYGCRYVWMDSLCINQGDEDELDESIRSMYYWYKNAAVCIVYLSDISPSEDITRSSWFTRGWTLQEFLAPERMVFYYKDWTPVSQSRYDIIRNSASNTASGSYQDHEGWGQCYDDDVSGNRLRERIIQAAGE
ncbi:hypothetical protein ONZ45_g8139 [Pleurotus djamor]|nr:hypothetical protein ONZ45_g8139 [Pleurotus djamor]